MLEKRLDNLKVFATLLVVLGHVGVFYSGLGVLEFPEQLGIKIMTRLLYSFHMPLFFFISDVIYGICIGKGKYGDVRVFVGKKVKRLLVPYLFWGIVVVTPVMALLHFTEDRVGKYILNGILLGRNNRHLWYLLSLFCMFLVTDGVRRIIKRGKAWWFVLTIAVVFALLYNRAPGIFNIGSTMRCWVYFVAGVVLEENGVLERETTPKRLLSRSSSAGLFSWYFGLLLVLSTIPSSVLLSAASVLRYAFLPLPSPAPCRMDSFTGFSTATLSGFIWLTP